MPSRPDRPRSAWIWLSRSNDRRAPVAALDRICDPADTLAPLLENAADAGARKSQDGMGFVGRGRGFTDADPTGNAVRGPGRAQLRRATRRASTLIFNAESVLEEAGSVIASAFLRTDPEKWIRAVEKRRAGWASRRNSPRNSPVPGRSRRSRPPRAPLGQPHPRRSRR